MSAILIFGWDVANDIIPLNSNLDTLQGSENRIEKFLHFLITSRRAPKLPSLGHMSRKSVGQYRVMLVKIF